MIKIARTVLKEILLWSIVVLILVGIPSVAYWVITHFPRLIAILVVVGYLFVAIQGVWGSLFRTGHLNIYKEKLTWNHVWFGRPFKGGGIGFAVRWGNHVWLCGRR